MAKKKLNDLLAALSGGNRLLIVPHNNPDPDALGACQGLKLLYESKTGGKATIMLGGMIGRSENRAMVRLLGIELTPARDIEFSEYPLVAMVDTQPSLKGHHSLPPSILPAVILDHHHASERVPEGVAFHWTATTYGATSSLMTSLLRLARVPIDTRIATGLLYGIKSDTQDLLRSKGKHDLDNYMHLFELADKRLLADIENAQVSREYYEDILRSLGKAIVRGKVIFSDIGRVEQPDMVAEMADFFSRLEGIRWSICLGLHRRSLILSVRSRDPRRHANWVVSRLVQGLGTGGGHGQMAAGRIPITEERPVDRLRAEIKCRAIDVLKVRRRREVKLVRESSQGPARS